VIQDDMQRFYEVAPQADRLVLASPIYLDHITAQMMAFIQRLFCYIGPPPGVANRYPRPGVGAVLGITFGVGRENAYDDVLDWMEGRLTGYFGIPTLRKFRVAGTADTPPVDASHPTIRQAVEFGRSLA